MGRSFQTDAALLDFLRKRGKTSELPPEETVRRTVAILSERGRFERLLKVADSSLHGRARCSARLGNSWGKSPPSCGDCGLR